MKTKLVPGSLANFVWFLLLSMLWIKPNQKILLTTSCLLQSELSFIFCFICWNINVPSQKLLQKRWQVINIRHMNKHSSHTLVQTIFTLIWTTSPEIYLISSHHNNSQFVTLELRICQFKINILNILYKIFL